MDTLAAGGEFIVKFDDATMMKDIKKAISMIKGVSSITLQKTNSKTSQQAIVKESLTRAFQELHAGQVKHDARSLFAE